MWVYIFLWAGNFANWEAVYTISPEFPVPCDGLERLDCAVMGRTARVMCACFHRASGACFVTRHQPGRTVSSQRWFVRFVVPVSL